MLAQGPLHQTLIANVAAHHRDQFQNSGPDQLALFPETSGRMQLRVTLPPEFPAGDHTVTVEVTSSVNGNDVAYADNVPGSARPADSSCRG